jgi:hypothetical protein
MPNDTVRASATALPKSLTKDFIAELRNAGHRPYVAGSGRFGIMLSVAKRRVAEAAHHNGPGYAYTLGFDDRPFLPLRDNPNWIAEVAAALAEQES